MMISCGPRRLHFELSVLAVVSTSCSFGFPVPDPLGISAFCVLVPLDFVSLSPLIFFGANPGLQIPVSLLQCGWRPVWVQGWGTLSPQARARRN